MSLILCFLSLMVYIVIILLATVAKNYVMNNPSSHLNSGFTVRESAQKILKHFNLVHVEEERDGQDITLVEDNDIKNDDDESDKENGQHHRSYRNQQEKHFDFSASKDEMSSNSKVILLSEKEGDDSGTNTQCETSDKDNAAQNQIKEKRGFQRFEMKHKGGYPVVCASVDYLDSESLFTNSAVAYEITCEHCENDKPLKYKLISVATFIPKIISQVGWVFPLCLLFGAVSLPTYFVTMCSTIIIFSVLLTTLNILFYRNNVAPTVQAMIDEQVIDESEKDEVTNALNIFSFGKLTKGFSFCVWFVRKILGFCEV